jgi:hypothetical protein
LRSMVRNTLTRSQLSHRLWHNDPDCILLRDTTKLTEAEVRTRNAQTEEAKSDCTLSTYPLIRLHTNTPLSVTRPTPLRYTPIATGR